MATPLFSEVRNRQLALQLRATLDDQYTAKPIERIGTVLGAGQVLVGNQRYTLNNAGAPLTVGSQIAVTNAERPAAAVYVPANSGGGGASGGGATNTLTQGYGNVIGGWRIDASSLSSGSGTTFVGLDSGGIYPAIYVGNDTPSLAPFQVTRNGTLYATGRRNLRRDYG